VAAAAGAARPGDRFTAQVMALAAVPPAAAAGWALLPAATVPDRLALAALLAGAAATAGQLVLRVVTPVLVAVVVGAVPVAVAGLAAGRLDVPGAAAAAAVGVLALLAGPVLPRAALALAGLPRPVVPADGGELTDADSGPDALPPAELAERAALARGYLAGLVGGCAGVAAGGTVVAAAAGGWAGPALATVTAVVLGLRSRGFADPAPVCTLLAGAAATATGLAALLVVRDPAVAGLLAAAVLLVAGGAGATALHRTRPAGTPVSRRAVDFLEWGLTLTAAPLALWVMGLFALAGRF
jgi:type VII secretion integral membrane protein EccD